MTSTFAVTGFGVADIHPQGDDSLDAGVRAFWEIDPKRDKEGHAAQWGGVGFEYRKFLGIVGPQGFDRPTKDPSQYTLTLPLHATFYPGDDYAHIQFSSGATWLTGYPSDSRDSASTATQERIGARLLELRGNWRAVRSPVLLGFLVAADWDLFHRNPGASSFTSFSQTDFVNDRWRISLGVELGLCAGKSQ